jgi:hypothetical protein
MLEQLLCFVSTPHLDHLILHGFGTYEIARLAAVLRSRGAAPWFPDLRTLEIVSAYGDESEDLDLVTENLMICLPTIQSLIMVNNPVRNTLRLLSTTTLWPSLSILHLGPLIVEGGSLLPMLKHRIHVGHPITKLFLPTTSHVIDYDGLKKVVEVEWFESPTSYESYAISSS